MVRSRAFRELLTSGMHGGLGSSYAMKSKKSAGVNPALDVERVRLRRPAGWRSPVSLLAALGACGREPHAAAHFERSTCSNSSSTGVARPKIETLTLTRLRSKSSSSTVPLKLAKGPSSTLTASPIS